MSARKREVRARNKARRAALAAPEPCPSATTWIVHGPHWWGLDPQAKGWRVSLTGGRDLCRRHPRRHQRPRVGPCVVLTLVPPPLPAAPGACCGHTARSHTLTWVCSLQPHPSTTAHVMRTLR